MTREELEKIPQFKREIVWCTTCGRSQAVNVSECMKIGWPKCCGYTMTIDSPEERKRLEELEKKQVKP
jgi:hypothetical protein